MLLLLLSVASFGCDGGSGSDAGVDASLDGALDGAVPAPRPVVAFDLSGSVDSAATFWDFPFPSDLRLRADGTPDLTGFPNPRVDVVSNLLPIAEDRQGWPTIPVGYFRFGAPLRARRPDTHFDAEPSAPVLLVDVDPDSPERGRLFATIATTFDRDGYTGYDLLGVASYPGIVLSPERTYAFVILRSLGAEGGAPLEVPDALAQLARGEIPTGAWGADAAALYAPLFETLDTIGVARESVAAATVFTTGDVVARTRAMSEAVLARETVTIEGLALDPSDGATHERYCELLGTVSMPQYQRGTPPFDTEGLFGLDAAGVPIEQRRETARVVITIPKGEMPAAGYPLMVYFHGSGGIAAQVVDRGPRVEGGVEAVGLGPAHMIAEHGFASVGSSLPLSPDRLPGADGLAYLNFDNLAAFRDTFRQGVIEQRLLIHALLDLRIDPSALAGCDGPTLPSGATEIVFDPDSVVGLGQSMGGMYTNLIGALEPRLSALVPTGAGGFWSLFILETQLIDGVRGLLGGLLRTDGAALTHLHPALHLLEIAWEAVEPMVYMPRISRSPLPGISARPIYEPVGLGDSYFPTAVYDAIALAYGHPQAGDVVFSSMQDSLSVGGLDGILPYPVSDNLTSATGESYTGVVVQSAGDGFSDPHEIFVQVPEIRYQWGCFLRTAIAGGAVVPAPAPEGTPCPTR